MTSLPRALWEERSGLPALLAALGGGDGDTRLVGGAVRDTLLALPVADIDLATRLAPKAVLARLAAAEIRAVPTGLAHGTVTAVLPSGPIEVTTLRRDVATDGRHATVAFTDDWRADAARRDFTINALSADPRDGKVHDYFGGLADLAPPRVRFIGAPLTRIAEDHLRILRFFRFHARFGAGMPDADGLAACTARADDLRALSCERIAQEVIRLLMLPRAADTLAVMLDHAILAPVLPEIGADGLARLRQLRASEATAGIPADPVRALAAVLGPDAGVVDAVARRLRLSNAQRKRLALASHPAERDPTAARPRAYRDGIAAATDQLLLGDLPNEAVTAALASLADWEPPRLPVGGARLIALGIAPGREVAAALARIEARWLAEGFPDAARVDAIAQEEAAKP